MRLWSISPEYLDPVGLVALWREGLLAQKVLLGLTKGYRNHTQLIRFRRSPDPVLYIGTYLYYVHEEARRRGYVFSLAKVKTYNLEVERLPISVGQLDYEFKHLLNKLRKRSPKKYRELAGVSQVSPHPLFRPVPGGVEDWERV
jgi:hypothetical protein